MNPSERNARNFCLWWGLDPNEPVWGCVDGERICCPRWEWYVGAEIDPPEGGRMMTKHFWVYCPLSGAAGGLIADYPFAGLCLLVAAVGLWWLDKPEPI